MLSPMEPASLSYPGPISSSSGEGASVRHLSRSPFPPEIEGVTEKESPAANPGIGKKAKEECQTCRSRKYQDGSTDPSVSFKAPASIAPGAEAYAVTAHEYQHVANEKGKAQRQGREVIYQTVQIHTAVCPECNRVYVAGGKTTTVTRQKTDSQAHLGKNIDFKI